MKKTVLLLTLCCVLAACKKNSVDFTYSPEAPRAGQAVTFTNQSTSGEEWEWTYGDGATSTLKSPSHTFKNPGTYLVTLKVDNKKSWMASHEVTIYDTVPTFVCADSVFAIYQEYTFTANLYNPYNYDVQYEWLFPINTPYAEVTDGKTDQAKLHLCFTQAMKEAPVWLRVIFNGDTVEVQKTFEVMNRTTNSLLLRTDQADYRQRIFGSRAEMAQPDASAKALLDAEQDTLQTYNDSTFRLSVLKTTFADIEGFHIANRKIYYRAKGLWVANMDGANPVQIDTVACAAMTLDNQDNRIYWANTNGVWHMPFVGSDNNKFVSTPTRLNTMTNVIKLAADNEPK